ACAAPEPDCGAVVEPGSGFQEERLGIFWVDAYDDPRVGGWDETERAVYNVSAAVFAEEGSETRSFIGCQRVRAWGGFTDPDVQMAALEAESEEQLQTKYDAVAKTYRAMVGEEKKRQRLLNGQALNRWLENASEHGGRPNFAAQIQAFSQLVQEVCDLTDSLEGKYTMLVQKFEEWFRKVQAIESMRLHRQQGDANHVVFIDPLDRVWKDEVHVMIVKLEQGLRQLQSLDITDYDGPEPALADAALVRTAKGLDVMIASMVDELKVILASTVPSTSAAAVYWQRSEI
ncbi:hypothetical protein KXX11_003109, partial [Aspergillus fumigatus]